MEHHNIETLKKHILPLSESNNFDKAKLEWKLSRVEVDDDWNRCPCNHPIKELCYIKNTLNGNETYVGNVCVNKFMDIDTGNIFEGLKRIAKKIDANPNKDLIEYANELGYLYEHEYSFLLQTKNKRKLSPKQKSWKERINKRILEETKIDKTKSKSEWTFVRKNSKGENIFRRDTNETLEFVIDFLNENNIEHEYKEGATMFNLINEVGKCYTYYWTTGKWSPKSKSMDMHYNSKGIKDFTERFFNRYNKDYLEKQKQWDKERKEYFLSQLNKYTEEKPDEDMQEYYKNKIRHLENKETHV